MSECIHAWHRNHLVERENGPNIFQCQWCLLYGWRKRFKANKDAPADPIRLYAGKRQEIMRERAVVFAPSTIERRPMSARRARNGGYLPPGSCGGRR